MTGLIDGSFEALMAAAEKVDGLLQGRRSRWGIVAILFFLLLGYALAPAPSEPGTPCPPEKTAGIGLSPPLWWVGGGPETPVLSSIGLDPNSRIDYHLLLGAAGEDMTPVGRARGGREMESLSINLTAPLAPGTAYQWQVVAENRIKKRAPGEVWTFTTRPLPEIELFEADASILDLGEEVTLRWSVENATEAEMGPGVGPVPLRGEVRLAPRENVTYTLTGRNFAGSVSSSLDVTVLSPLAIDSMAGGWSTYEDGRGSAISGIRAVPGVVDDATRISFDLSPGGVAGIAKVFSSTAGEGGLNLAGTDGLSFHLRGGGDPTAFEVMIVDGNGSLYRRPWDEGAVPGEWARMEARYEEFGGAGAEGICEEIGNVIEFRFLVSIGDGDEGASGWIAIDDLEAFHRRRK